MGESEERFALLLTEGVKRISIRERKTISLVHDELGYAIGREGGSAIEYWRKGHIPAEQSDVEKLAREITRRSGPGRKWLEQFLDSSGYSDLMDLCDELFPPPPLSHIPSRPYKELVGRDVYMRDIMTALRDPDGRWSVAIDGMGGIGKTALAREVAERSLNERWFDTMVWISASKGGHASGDSRGGVALTFDTILDIISRQLGASEIKLKAAEKETLVQALLRRKKVLVVLDNLETAAEPQDSIVERLQPLLGYSKVLLTSRHRFSGEVYPIHLTGLDEDGSKQFISQVAEERGISHVKTANSIELNQIAYATGGSPLALKFVVGLLFHLPLEIVLNHLREAQPLRGRAEEDDFIQFYRFIFLPSWHLLSDDCEKLLISMAPFTPEIGGTFEALRTIGHLPERLLARCIDELWRLSFLEVGESPGLRQKRYYLHALTQYFVLSDILELLR